MKSRKKPAHRILWERIEELGLTPNYVSGRADVDRVIIDELESDDDLETNWTLGEIKRVVAVLGLNFLDVFGISCAYCGKVDRKIREWESLPRNELIIRRREELGLSKEDLLAKAGFTAWFAEYRNEKWAQEFWRKYQAIEDAPDNIDELIFGSVELLNDRVLHLPLHLLVGAKCASCGKGGSPGARG